MVTSSILHASGHFITGPHRDPQCTRTHFHTYRWCTFTLDLTCMFLCSLLKWQALSVACFWSFLILIYVMVACKASTPLLKLLPLTSDLCCCWVFDRWGRSSLLLELRSPSSESSPCSSTQWLMPVLQGKCARRCEGCLRTEQTRDKVR